MAEIERKILEIAKIMDELNEEFKWTELLTQIQNSGNWPIGLLLSDPNILDKASYIALNEMILPIWTKGINLSPTEIDKLKQGVDWPIGVIDYNLRSRITSKGNMFITEDEELRLILERQSEDIIVRYLEKLPLAEKNRVFNLLKKFIRGS